VFIEGIRSLVSIETEETSLSLQMMIKKEKGTCQKKHNERNGKKCKLKYRILYVSLMTRILHLQEKDYDIVKFEGEQFVSLFSRNAKNSRQREDITFGELHQTISIPVDPIRSPTPDIDIVCRSDGNSDDILEDEPNGNIIGYNHLMVSSKATNVAFA
jgi:hypothetical protein